MGVCKKGFSYCQWWDGDNRVCPGCDEAKKEPRAICSICQARLQVTIAWLPADRDIHIMLECPKHGVIKRP